MTWMFSDEEVVGGGGREAVVDDSEDDLDDGAECVGVLLPVDAGEMLALIDSESERCLSRFGADSFNTATSFGDKHNECARLLGRLAGGDRENASSISSLDSERRGLLPTGDCGERGETDAMEDGVSAEAGEAEAGTSLKRTPGRSMTSDGFLRIGCFTLCA